MALAFGAASATVLRSGGKPKANEELVAKPEVMNITAHQFMEVQLGPFPSAPEACDYCFSSFTKEGQKPAGPIAPACVCMAYPDAGGHNMFCATPTSAAGYVAEKGGCRCKGRDMEHMAATTCEPIS